MTIQGRFAAHIAAALVVCGAMMGCGSLTIHDEGRAKLASDGHQAYLDAKVTEAPAIEAKNLDFLLSEEIKSVDSNVALQVDFAALGIANNVGPMSDSFDAAKVRLGELGFSGGPGEVRAFFDKRLMATAKLRTAKTEAGLLASKGMTPPDCDVITALAPEALPKPPDELKSIFVRYVKACNDASLPPLPGPGLVEQAAREWGAAQLELSKLAAETVSARAQVQTASAVYQAAAEKNAGSPDLAKKLTDEEAQLLNALKNAQKLKLGGAFDSSINALVETLNAAATDAAEPGDPAQARAAVVLKALPSLAADAQAFQNSRTALPVSGLLLELQRQTVLANSAAQQMQLMQQRVAILKAALDGHLDEARNWLRFTDAVCSNAVLVAGGKHPGVACDTFTVTSPECAILGKTIRPCILAQSWKARFVADKGEAKRELYKAATSYLQAVAAQAPALEQQYREIDVRHREALLAKTTALAAWDNLVSVPLDQLDAYYKGGIKPAELADLIVKSLGVVAITVGVSK